MKLLIYFFLLLTFLLTVSPIFAQQPNQLDLTTSPLFFEFSTEKGTTIKDKIRLRNNSANPISLNVGLQRLAPGQNSEVTLSDPKAGDEFVSWLAIEKQTITARPREWTDIPFTLKIPETAAFGYYFAFLLTQTPPEPEAGTAKVTGGIAVPVLLNVKAPGAIAKAELLEFKPKAFINEIMPVEFVARVSNTGNVHLKPRGNIFIRGVGGKDLAILEINQELGSILPDATRSFEVSWTDGFLVREPVTEDGKVLTDEKGNTKTKLSVNWNKLTEFRFGRYNGQLLMAYDDGTRDVTLEGITAFWVIPYKITAGLTIGVIAFVLIIRKFLQAYVEREVRRRKES